MYRPVQIGAVSYLNSKPLIEDLAELTAGEAELVLDYPSRLADDLAEGELDVALIPSFECFLQPDYEVVSDACVATHGPVMSVKLYSRVPLGEIRTLALDEGSRTSAALSRIMLAERFGVFPRLEPLPLGLSTESTTADAILLIGDRAMHLPEEPFAAVWDLGEEWLSWTGLPFVFALWATRRSTELGVVESALREARDRGVDRLDAIAHREAKALGLDPRIAQEYLRRNLHFQLGSAEQSGLKLFQQLAVQAGLAPGGVNLVFRDCTDTRKSQSRRTAHVG
jgi:chorismate dehydratase